MRGSRLFSRSLAMSVLAGCTLAVATTSASADANTPSPYVLGSPLGVSTQSRLVVAGSHMYISQGKAGSDVVVLDSAGNRVADITGEAGASGMAVSPDGSKVYVALANTNAISVIDTATQTEASRLTVDSCPVNLAFSSGRLFYSFGCNPGQWSSGVSSIDPTNPATPVVGVTRQYSPPLLAGSATRLVVGDVGLSPSTVTVYDTSTNDGTMTSGATNRDSSNLEDLAVTPDGAHLLTASGAPYQINEYTLPGLEQTMVFPGVAYPEAVAVSPDGMRVAGGFSSYGDQVHLYDASSGSGLWKRYATSGLTSSGTWATPDDKVLPGGLAFSADGSTVMALVADQSSGAVALFRSVLAPSATSVTQAIPGVAYGKTQTATATVHGAASVPLTFVRTADGVTKSLGTAISNSSGTAAKTVGSAYNGYVQTTYNGDASHLPSTVRTWFTVASKTTVSLSGYYKTVNSVRYYKSYKKVHATIAVRPKVTSRAVTVILWRRSGTHWVKSSSLAAHTDSLGNVYIYLKSAPSHVKLKFTTRFSGDSFNRASTSTSGLFIIA